MSKIFISYRRDDSSGYAGRLFDRLTKVVMGVDAPDTEEGVGSPAPGLELAAEDAGN